MDTEYVRSRFIKHFDGTTGFLYASPGRINLIGEHTDYNGGFVFPGAVDKGMIAEIKPNGTDKVRAYSIDLKDYVEFGLNEEDAPRASWARYIFGVCREMIKRGVDVKGFNTAFAGDVPLGAGMSSSAALESTYAFALNELFGDNKIDKFELAKVGQATEHNYCGVNCGIMDQFASVFGKAGSLIRLDCRSLEYKYYPFNPVGYKLVLLDSVVKHELASSAYNKRRKSCENVVAAIRRNHPKVEFLRDATMEMLNEVKADVSAEDYMRAEYVIEEIQRVLDVCAALEKGDYETVGEKMYGTHQGMSKLYEVSCEELDFLNDIAKECGVTGSQALLIFKIHKTMSAAFYQDEVKFYVAVDCIILGFNNKELNVLLYKRSFEPMKGQWSLMGGFVKSGESVDEAASRVLTDCTGIEHLFMEQIGAYGDVSRDLGERVISVAYYSLVNMNDFSPEILENHNATWTKISELPDLIFDHNQMINDTLSVLKKKAASRPIGFNLLPEQFTLPQLQTLYEAIYQTLLDKRNFRKKLNAMDILEKLDIKDKKSSKRGAFLYKFNEKKYNKWVEQGFDFSL